MLWGRLRRRISKLGSGSVDTTYRGLDVLPKAASMRCVMHSTGIGDVLCSGGRKCQLAAGREEQLGEQPFLEGKCFMQKNHVSIRF